MGFSSSRSLNALEAVKAALREKPQLILIDSRRPFIDGLEATRRIRENRHLDQVKILALNGSSSPRYHAEALAAGCNDSIEKLFDIERLRTYVACTQFYTTVIWHYLLLCLCRISVLPQEVKSQHHDRRYQQ